MIMIIAMMSLKLHTQEMHWRIQTSQEMINHLIYMNDTKLFAKDEKELDTPIKAVRIYSQDIGLESGREIYAPLVMKSGKRHMTEGMELPNQEKLVHSGKRKRANTWEYWKQILPNMWK